MRKSKFREVIWWSWFFRVKFMLFVDSLFVYGGEEGRRIWGGGFKLVENFFLNIEERFRNVRFRSRRLGMF